VHELAHAAVLLWHGYIVDLYFSDCTVSEERFVVENCLFGGRSMVLRFAEKKMTTLIDGKPTGIRETHGLSEWPDAAVVQHYQTIGPIGVRGPSKEVYVIGKNPAAYSLNLLQDSWWNDVYNKEGLQSLHAPKVRGFLWICTGAGESIQWRMGMPYPSRKDVPDGYGFTRQGLVVPLGELNKHEDFTTRSLTDPADYSDAEEELKRYSRSLRAPKQHGFRGHLKGLVSCFLSCSENLFAEF
jgi:hypothetical protein